MLMPLAALLSPDVYWSSTYACSSAFQRSCQDCEMARSWLRLAVQNLMCALCISATATDSLVGLRAGAAGGATVGKQGSDEGCTSSGHANERARKPVPDPTPGYEVAAAAALSALPFAGGGQGPAQMAQAASALQQVCDHF